MGESVTGYSSLLNLIVLDCPFVDPALVYGHTLGDFDVDLLRFDHR